MEIGKYEACLKKIREENNDTYTTLNLSNKNLRHQQQDIATRIENVTETMNKDGDLLGTRIMTINNNIATKQKQLDALEKRKFTLQSLAEESNSNKLAAVSDIGQAIMSIQNLYEKCLEQKEFSKQAQKDKINMAKDQPLKINNTKIVKGKDINLKNALNNELNVQQRDEIAREQVNYIMNNIQDYEKIIKNMSSDEKAKEYYNAAIEKYNEEF